MKRIFSVFAVASFASASVYAGTFTDVPKNHWAYKAVEEVTSTGIIKGYQEKFNGNEKVSRYEMALIVSRLLAAVQGGSRLDANMTKTLNQLISEFSNELALLGAKVEALEARTANSETRIDELEKKVSAGASFFGRNEKVNFSGSLGLRWQAMFADGFSDRITDSPQVRFELKMDGKLNDKTDWAASFATRADDKPSSSWKSAGSANFYPANTNNTITDGAELDLLEYRVGYVATDDLKFTLGKQDVPFRNTELVFDNDIRLFGISENYKIDKNWTFRAGQYHLMNGQANPANPLPLIDPKKEDAYLFAHQIEYKTEEFGGKWVARASNLNFTGEQFLHPAFGITASAFNQVAGANATTFANSNIGMSGNYYNNNHTLNTTTNSRQYRLLSDFNLFNLYLGYENIDNPKDPWGVKFDYVINNSAWNEDDEAYWFEIWKGKLAKKGDVRYGYQYKYVDADAVLAFLNQDILMSNTKGSAVYFETQLQDNVKWFTNYFLFEPANGTAIDKEGILRTGLMFTF